MSADNVVVAKYTDKQGWIIRAISGVIKRGVYDGRVGFGFYPVVGIPYPLIIYHGGKVVERYDESILPWRFLPNVVSELEELALQVADIDEVISSLNILLGCLLVNEEIDDEDSVGTVKPIVAFSLFERR